ncbi:MAG: hypothetical protein M3P51_16525, partial [Chloroflexota bacterium]|nr:hypothetical protein [Chloroflexota bacterium]
GYLRAEVKAASTLKLRTIREVNEAGVVTSLIKPRGVVSRLVVDEHDRTVDVLTGGPGYRTRMYYHRTGLLARRVRTHLNAAGAPLPDGDETVTFTYDPEDNITKKTIGGENIREHLVTQHRYDASGRQMLTILPRGNTIHQTYDERLLPRTRTRAACSSAASTTTTWHDGDGRKSLEVDARGQETRFTYDALGRLIESLDPLGNLSQYEHDKSDNTLVERRLERRPDGGFTLLSRRSYVYDERGNRVRDISYLFEDPINVENVREAPEAEFQAALEAGTVSRVETRYYFDPKRRLFKVLDAKGQETIYEYDEADRRVVERDALGNYTRTTYDANSNIVRIDRHERVGAGAEEIFSVVNEYDDLDRKRTVTDVLGNRTEYSYDSRGNVVAVRDPLGNVRRYEYDIYNRKVAETLEMTRTGAGGGPRLRDVVTRFSYDENGNLTAITDARGAPTGSNYDQLDRLESTTYAGGSVTHLEYDGADNLVARTDGNGLRVINDYDPIGRKVRVGLVEAGLNPGGTHPAWARNLEEYRYDALGRMILHRNGLCQVRTRYDSLGRAMEERIRLSIADASTESLVIRRAFDILSNRIHLAYPSRREICYEYDGLNRVVGIRNAVKGNAYQGSRAFTDRYEIAAYEYQGLRLARAVYGNKAGYELSYDGMGRVISIVHTSAGGPFLEIQQLCDGAGNVRFRLDRSKRSAKPEAEVYGYDSLYRLTGHRREVRNAINPRKYAPASAPLPLESMRGQRAIDEAIGAMLQDPSGYTYAYDSLGNRSEERWLGQNTVAYVANQLNQY